MQILIFASSDCLDVFRQAKTLAEETGARLINKLSSNLDDLLLVVEFGVVEPFVVIVRDERGVRARLTDPVTAHRLKAAVEALRA